jgi:hypothetical protein
VLSLVAVSTATAHHSASATYSADESITIKGTVLEFAWTNPHGHVYIDVTEGPFKGQTYMVELSSPNALDHDGWTKTMLRHGDHIVMNVHPSRAGAAVGLCRHCAFTINGKVTRTRGVQ